MNDRLPIIELIVPIALLLVGAIWVGAAFGAGAPAAESRFFYRLARSLGGIFLIAWGFEMANGALSSTLSSARKDKRRKLTDSHYQPPLDVPLSTLERLIRAHPIPVALVALLLACIVAYLGDLPGCDSTSWGLGGVTCDEGQ